MIEWLERIKVGLGIILIPLALWDITRGKILLATLTGIVGILMLLPLFLKIFLLLKKGQREIPKP